ncbi:MAG TPA: hypothetical protein VNP92_32695 [Actinophytocola sp.]|nr:hypothetical protein [Actinophytocola sp.]
MDQATSNVRETAAFARRVVVRTLTVVGAAAAGTAIAWCLSTASAAADTDSIPVQDPSAPVVTELVAPVSVALDRITDRLPETPQPPKVPIGSLGEKVKAATGNLGEHAGDQLPACADQLCRLDELGQADGSADAGLDRADHPSPAPAPLAAAGKVTGPGVDPDRTAARTAADRAYADGMSRRGSPTLMPSLPDFPGWPVPLVPAPVNVPASGHNGSTGNPADSSLFAALPWQDRTSALVRGLTVPATEAITSGRIGAQPGVAPD